MTTPKPCVRLERPSARRQRDYLEAAVRSRALHRGWVVLASTPSEYSSYLRATRRANQESFFIVEPQSNELAGVVNINEIVRGAELSARLGYYAFVPHAGKGLLRAGLERVIDLAFGELGLHRLEANIQPGNVRSLALAERLGFRCEGNARGFLKIGNRWRDHERWALLKEDWLRR